MDFQTAVRKGLRIELCSVQREAFDLYYRKLIQARHKANLTSLRDRESIERRHFGESIALLSALTDAGLIESPVIDIGSGAGFPGLLFKILRPDLQITLLEATAKKVQFMAEIVHQLRLGCSAGARASGGVGARSLPSGSIFARAARAVAPLRVLVELALPFVRIGGHLAAPSGQRRAEGSARG
jgi:16S rRNA (guanine527-N7)-methyltransferase